MHFFWRCESLRKVKFLKEWWAIRAKKPVFSHLSHEKCSLYFKLPQLSNLYLGWSKSFFHHIRSDVSDVIGEMLFTLAIIVKLSSTPLHFLQLVRPWSSIAFSSHLTSSGFLSLIFFVKISPFGHPIQKDIFPHELALFSLIMAAPSVFSQQHAWWKFSQKKVLPSSTSKGGTWIKTVSMISWENQR